MSVRLLARLFCDKCNVSAQVQAFVANERRGTRAVPLTLPPGWTALGRYKERHRCAECASKETGR